MSLFNTIALWLVRPLAGAKPAAIDPEAFSLRQWADLPVHHPCRQPAALRP